RYCLGTSEANFTLEKFASHSCPLTGRWYMTATCKVFAALSVAACGARSSPLGKSAGWFILGRPQAAVQRQALCRPEAVNSGNCEQRHGVAANQRRTGDAARRSISRWEQTVIVGGPPAGASGAIRHGWFFRPPNRRRRAERELGRAGHRAC